MHRARDNHKLLVSSLILSSVALLSLLLAVHYLQVRVDGGLIGEELASAFVSVVFLENRHLLNGMSVNFSSQLFFWAISHIPNFGIESARVAKIIAISFLPLVMGGLLKISVRQISVWTIVWGISILSLAPTVLWYSVMATEYNLDLPFAFLAILLAMSYQLEYSARSFAVFGILLLLILYVPHIYGASLLISPIVAVIFCSRVLTGEGSRSFKSAMIAAFLAAFVVGVVWPGWIIVEQLPGFARGGGALASDFSEVAENLRVTFGDIFSRTDSYLSTGYFEAPAFSIRGAGLSLLIFALIGTLRAFRSRRLLWLVLIGVSSILIVAVASNNPGIRRATPLVVALCMLASSGLDWIFQAQKLRLFCAALSLFLALWAAQAIFTYGALSLSITLVFALGLLFITHRKPALFKPLVGLSALFIVGVQGKICVDAYQRFSTVYSAWLQRDFRYLPGMNYEESVEALVARLTMGKNTFSVKDYDPETFALLHLLCVRRHMNCVVPDLEVPKGRWIDRRMVGITFNPVELPAS